MWLLQQAELSSAVPPVLPGSEGPGSLQLALCRYCEFQVKPLLILLGRKRWLLNAACSNRKYLSQSLKSFTQNTASFFLTVFSFSFNINVLLGLSFLNTYTHFPLSFPSVAVPLPRL